MMKLILLLFKLLPSGLFDIFTTVYHFFHYGLWQRFSHAIKFIYNLYFIYILISDNYTVVFHMCD